MKRKFVIFPDGVVYEIINTSNNNYVTHMAEFLPKGWYICTRIIDETVFVELEN